jgi:hypothetical protein
LLEWSSPKDLLRTCAAREHRVLREHRLLILRPHAANLLNAETDESQTAPRETAAPTLRIIGIASSVAARRAFVRYLGTKRH